MQALRSLLTAAAGLGRAAGASDPDRYEHAYAFCDVLVIGAGPAGLAAALVAACSGARVIVCDEDFCFGGRLLAERRDMGGTPGHVWTRRVVDELTSLPDLNQARMPASRPQPTDVVQLAQRVAAASEAAAPGNCRVVVLSAVPEMVGLWDAAHLERALANLMDNALKYNREDRPVAVTLRQADTCAVISVADQGVGIPAAEQSRVFERPCLYRQVAR